MQGLAELFEINVEIDFVKVGQRMIFKQIIW